MLLEAVEEIMDDERVAEIVVVDDASTDGSYERLWDWAVEHKDKVQLYRNEHNLDCYGNKAKAVFCCKNQWVILFDSDNTLTRDYLNHLYAVRPWSERHAFLPTYAMPHFDYREFAGIVVTKSNVQHYVQNETFRTALNTANYFFQREYYLACWNKGVNPHTADSIYMNYRWLEAGHSLVFVAGLHYTHRVHDNSHYKLNEHKTGQFAKQVEAKLAALK